MPKNEELTAIFLEELHRWGDTVILRCDLPQEANGNRFPNGSGDLWGAIKRGISVKTTADVGELVPYCSYRFFGHWTEYHNKRCSRKEPQFHAKTWVRCQPHGRTGTIRYLMQCPNVKEGRAQALWDKFGPDAVRILRESPDVAADVLDKGFTAEKAKEAAAWLKDEQAMEGCSIDLMDLLAGRGFPRGVAKRAVREWGNRASELIRKNPYLLMAFRGCGFLRTDRLYLDMGGQPGRLKRQALCAWYTLASDTDGNTWHRPSTVETGLKKRIAGANVASIAAVKLALRGKLLGKYRDEHNGLWLAEEKKGRHEADIAEWVRFRSGPDKQYHWPDVSKLDVSPHQREQAGKAMQPTSAVAILGGSPGTGKTYTGARVIAAAVADFGLGEVAVCAPTGKAAVRITEAMQGYGLQIKARTIHGTLGVEARSESDGWGFRHNADNPLPFRLVVVDESSMIDTDLFAALLAACGEGTQLLLIGDTNQLPPVGHGRPLYDLIAAGVPYGELREIQRNAGRIVKACAEMRDGQRFRTSENLDPDSGENLALISTANNSASARRIEEALTKIRERKLFDPIWDVQVIVAVNAKSELSRKDMNKRLQTLLNPAGKQAAGNPFRLGDKIVCLKNGFYPLAEDGLPPCDQDVFDVQTNDKEEVYVANGEQARVVEVSEKLTIAKLASPVRTIKIARGKGSDNDEGGDSEKDDTSGAGCNWDLAYAISCHKSQGSEWPCVIVALDEYPGAKMVCSRNWLYTAISRAKKVCLLVGKRQTADSMCLRDAISTRKTFLKERISLQRGCSA